MVTVGPGCCRFKDWIKNIHDQGNLTATACKAACMNDENCTAADSQASLGCRTYAGSGINVHTECGGSGFVCWKKSALFEYFAGNFQCHATVGAPYYGTLEQCMQHCDGHTFMNFNRQGAGGSHLCTCSDLCSLSAPGPESNHAVYRASGSLWHAGDPCSALRHATRPQV